MNWSVKILNFNSLKYLVKFNYEVQKGIKGKRIRFEINKQNNKELQMKFSNIAAAFTLFASSFTQATNLSTGEEVEPSYTDLLQRIEQIEGFIASLKEGYDGWFGSTLRKIPLWGDQDLETNFEWPTE